MGRRRANGSVLDVLLDERVLDGEHLVVQLGERGPLRRRLPPARPHHGVDGAGRVKRRLERAARLQVAHHLLVRHALVRLLGVREHLPQADAERPHVRRRRVPVEHDRLERHPADGYGVVVGAGVAQLIAAAPARPLRQAEVGDLDRDAAALAGGRRRPVRAHQAVPRGQVAVNEAALRQVQHARGDLAPDASQVGGRQLHGVRPRRVDGRCARRRPARRARRRDDEVGRAARAQVLPQVAELHVLEQQAHGLVHGAHAEQRDDVRVIHLGEETRLLIEIGAHLVVGLLLERLDRHDGARLALDQIGRLRLRVCK